MLNSKQVKNYLFAVHAGIGRETYPLWNFEVERRMINWCAQNDQKLYRSMLSIVEPHKWNHSSSESFLAKKENARFEFDLEFPEISRKITPDFAEILGALFYVKKEGNYNWIASNIIAGRRLLIKKGFHDLLVMVLLGVVDCSESWITPHTRLVDPSELIEELIGAYSENTEIHWSSGLKEILVPRMEKFLKDSHFNGWLSSFSPESIKNAFGIL